MNDCRLVMLFLLFICSKYCTRFASIHSIETANTPYRSAAKQLEHGGITQKWLMRTGFSLAAFCFRTDHKQQLQWVLPIAMISHLRCQMKCGQRGYLLRDDQEVINLKDHFPIRWYDAYAANIKPLICEGDDSHVSHDSMISCDVLLSFIAHSSSRIDLIYGNDRWRILCIIVSIDCVQDKKPNEIDYILFRNNVNMIKYIELDRPSL